MTKFIALNGFCCALWQSGAKDRAVKELEAIHAQVIDLPAGEFPALDGAVTEKTM